MLKKSETLSSKLTKPSSQDSALAVDESSKLEAAEVLGSDTAEALHADSAESLHVDTTESFCSADKLDCAPNTASTEKTKALPQANASGYLNNDANDSSKPRPKIIHIEPKHKQFYLHNHPQDFDAVLKVSNSNSFPPSSQSDVSADFEAYLNLNSSSNSAYVLNSTQDTIATQSLVAHADSKSALKFTSNDADAKETNTEDKTAHQMKDHAEGNVEYKADDKAEANVARKTDDKAESMHSYLDEIVTLNNTAAQDLSSVHVSSAANTSDSNSSHRGDNKVASTSSILTDETAAKQIDMSSAHNSESNANNNAENLGEAIYDGELQSSLHTEKLSRRRVFLRSLQFRIIWIVTLAGLVSMTIMSVLSHNKINKSTHDFVDEELSQIASVAINYRMIIPRRWEAPRHYHDRIMRLMQQPDGTIIMQLSTDNRQKQAQELAREPAKWFNEQERAAQNQDANAQVNSNGYGRGYGAGQGYGGGRGLGQGYGARQGNGGGEGLYRNNAQTENTNQSKNPMQNWASQSGTPSLSDLYNLNYDIMIAPLYGRPGDALYIPLGVSDGFYTVMVADERVRAFVATNANGQRFVVARPLSSLVELMRQSFYASFLQFFLIDLIAIPLIIILSINFMLRSLNKLAQELYHRSDDDLSPVVTSVGRQKGFIPSELDGFIISINRLFQRVDESIQSKQRFIADAAHEMRTQSTVLSLQIAALDKEELSPSARLKVKRLKDGIAREKNLMTSLLTLAREQGCSDLSLENINIFELYTKLIEEQGLVADHKNIDLGVEGEVNFTVISDRAKLTRIMSNLMSNAIKYTPEDGRIDLKAQQHPDGRLTLTVQDDGPGIPPEHLKHILEPFYRVDGDRSAVQGTGLGLAIVKASCDSLKAQLRFANATPHGLIASVTLKDLQDKTVANAQQNSQD